MQPIELRKVKPSYSRLATTEDDPPLETDGFVGTGDDGTGLSQNDRLTVIFAN
jgi:hypothetical protein